MNHRNWKLAIVAAGLVAALVGFSVGNWPLAAVGVIGTGAVAFFSLRLQRGRNTVNQDASASSPAASPTVRTDSDLVRKMLVQGLSALLLRPEIIGNLKPAEENLAVEALERAMTLVPQGEVVVGAVDTAIDEGTIKLLDLPNYHAQPVVVEALLIDRHLVTNRQYFDFVADGGYETVALWDDEVLPALFEFVDRTGLPGPKYWNNQRFPAGEADHPVVGVSWYEAAAFARWIGKRLVSDAEWVKTGSWPVSPAPGMWTQRKYPWGNAFDSQRANLWSSGIGKTVSVHDYPEGVSVGGVHQMVGNVWEWTASPFGLPGDTSLSLPVPMKSIRGGAFDTYFENQATCHFQSGENPFHRKHNIGFRLGLAVRDLAPHVMRRLTHGDAPEPEVLEEVCA